MSTLRRSQKPQVVERPFEGGFVDILAGNYYAPKKEPIKLQRQVLFENDFVKKFARKERTIDGYKIERDYPEEYSCGYGRIFGDTERKTQFYDNTDAIVLTKNDEAVAFASYSRYGDQIKITQIQGTYGKTEDLKDLYWGRALIRAIEEIAKKNKVGKIVIRSAKNAMYPEIKGNSEPGEAGFTIYDVNARRCKYKKNQETGDYEKEINEEK